MLNNSMLRDVFNNWLACIGAFFLLTLTPVATVSNWQSLIWIGSLWWLFGVLIRPILKLVLLPFNIISLGAIGALVQFLAIWLIFWLIPSFQLHSVLIQGFRVEGWLLIAAVAFVISIFQRLLLSVLSQLFH